MPRPYELTYEDLQNDVFGVLEGEVEKLTDAQADLDSRINYMTQIDPHMNSDQVDERISDALIQKELETEKRHYEDMRQWPQKKPAWQPSTRSYMMNSAEVKTRDRPGDYEEPAVFALKKTFRIRPSR